eukprot:s793_g2.t1
MCNDADLTLFYTGRRANSNLKLFPYAAAYGKVRHSTHGESMEEARAREQRRLRLRLRRQLARPRTMRRWVDQEEEEESLGEPEEDAEDDDELDGESDASLSEAPDNEISDSDEEITQPISLALEHPQC